MSRHVRFATLAAVSAGMVCAAAGALAQTNTTRAGASPAPTQAAQPARRVAVNPKRETLQKMQRRMTIDFKESRLEDVITFIQEISGAEFDPMWQSDRGTGMNKDKLITVAVRNEPALRVLEKVLDKAQEDFEENTWQLSDVGALEIGPKSALNKSKRVEIYDINDLLHVIPRYTEVPQIDLQSVLQQGQGGGQTPFQDTNNQQQEQPRTREQRTQDIIDLLITLVEPTQWIDNGGDGASIRAWNGQLIVRGPDYMHRQINGYAFWPSYTASTVQGRRYVSLDTDNSIGKIDGFAQQPVTGTTGGAGGGTGVPPP
ncbi:MAG: hypothetical protein KF699_04135 [Phycisphaeraceae bacterium]|nr:hypothetical protein [Phycisphaeraceae bacterium]